MSLKLSVAVLTLSEPSLTNTIAVLLSHEVCTAMIRTHRCGLDRDSEQSSSSVFIQNLHRGSNGKNQKMSLLLLHVCCYASPVTVFAQKRSQASPLQDKNLPASCSRWSDCTHKLAPSHARPAGPATGPLTGPLPRRVAARRYE